MALFSCAAHALLHMVAGTQFVGIEWIVYPQRKVSLSMTIELANAYTLLAELSRKYLSEGSRASGTLAPQ